MPCSAGHLPVKYVDCDDVVRAGSTGAMVVRLRVLMYFFKNGVCSPINEDDNPTMSMTTVFFMRSNIQNYGFVLIFLSEFGFVRFEDVLVFGSNPIKPKIGRIQIQTKKS